MDVVLPMAMAEPRTLIEQPNESGVYDDQYQVCVFCSAVLGGLGQLAQTAFVTSGIPLRVLIH